LTRAIDQDFQERAKARESEAVTPTSNPGGEHGH
jgi:hypothetical protein